MIYLRSRLDNSNHQIKFSSNCFPVFLWMFSMDYNNYLLIPLYYRVTMRNGRLTRLTNLSLIRKFNFYVRQVIVLLCIINIISSIHFSNNFCQPDRIYLQILTVSHEMVKIENYNIFSVSITVYKFVYYDNLSNYDNMGLM